MPKSERTTYGPYTVVERLTPTSYLVRCRCGREYTRSAASLAAYLNRDVSGCRECSPAYGKMRKDVRNARVVRGRGEGMSLAELAEKFGITRQRVCQILKQGAKG